MDFQDVHKQDVFLLIIHVWFTHNSRTDRFVSVRVANASFTAPRFTNAIFVGSAICTNLPRIVLRSIRAAALARYSSGSVVNSSG
jgi:hypothetical protein